VKGLNRCDAKFLYWFSNAYSELPEGEDFLVNVEFLHSIWSSCWSSAYSVGRARGHRQGWQHAVGGPRFPMGFHKMEELFIGCKTGREFGLRIEKWHRIGLTNGD